MARLQRFLFIGSRSQIGKVAGTERYVVNVKTNERKMNEILSRMFLLLCNFFEIGGWDEVFHFG